MRVVVRWQQDKNGREAREEIFIVVRWQQDTNGREGREETVVVVLWQQDKNGLVLNWKNGINFHKMRSIKLSINLELGFVK